MDEEEEWEDEGEEGEEEDVWSRFILKSTYVSADNRNPNPNP